ncbi:MAG: VIT and VWA domain-containing protein, partial [Methanomicrobiales archaeon]|nr:VIT and VWA domain-containing protein [Methanomicrobiales archaeon]
MIFNSKWFDNSRIDGFAVLEIAGNSGAERMFVPLTRTHLNGRIDGPLADFTLSQTFRYSKEVYPSTIEALYRFPLPGDAAVLDVEVRFGNVVIHTTLKPRADAETDYNTAKKDEKAAVLVTRESPDVFTLKIAGIVPDEDVVIKTRYIQMGVPEQRGYSFRIPLTTAPRYVRSDERYSRHAKGQPLAVICDPGHRFSLNISSGGKGTLRSPTHQLAATQENKVTLSAGDVMPDRDCILVWEPASHGDVPSCQVFTDGEPELHFLALITPPEQSPVRLPRDVIILVDHSGSMNGAKHEAADWAVKQFIKGLSENDTFNLCLFESISYWLSEEPKQATNIFKEHAILFLDDKRSGGTELGVALEQALSQPRRKGAVARHVIIITDGEVTDTGRILQLVDRESGKKDMRRCNILCIDSAPNSYFVQQVTKRGGGIAKFLTSSPEEEDITSALDEILSFWDAPVAVGLGLAVNRPGPLVNKRKVRKSDDGRSVIDLGDLPAGKNQWVVARADPSPERVSFELLGTSLPASTVSVTASPTVRALFGAWLVAELEALMHAGYPEPELLMNLKALDYDPCSITGQIDNAVYAENRMKSTMDIVKNLIIDESLKYGVLSSETAFVALREENDRKVEEQVIVPNALIAGWSESFITPPREYQSPKKDLILPSCKIVSRDRPCAGGFFDLGYSDFSLIRQLNPGWILFSGKPQPLQGRCLIFDSTLPEHTGTLPETLVLRSLEFSFKEKDPVTSTGVVLLLYVGDPDVPRVRIRIKDLMDHHGVRPLNIQRTSCELLKIV